MALRATAPKLGGNLQLSAFGIQNIASTPHLFASLRPTSPLSIGSCELQLDITTMVQVAAIPVVNNFNLVVPIPNDPRLGGKDLRMGFLVYPSSAPPLLGFDILNAVELRIGR